MQLVEMPRRWRLLMPLALFVMVVTLFSIHPTQVHAQAPGETCAVTPNQVDGQGLNVASFGLSVTPFGLSVSQFGLNVSGFGLSVSQFGLTVSQFGQTPEEIVQDIIDNLVTPQWLIDLLPTIQIGSEFNTEKTFLLVVDDFSAPDAHGPQVRQVLSDLFAALADEGIIPNVEIVPVDISDPDPAKTYEAKAIADKIKAAVDGLPVGEGETKRVVINMSFGLIPCDDPGGVIPGTDGFVAPTFDFDDFLSTLEEESDPDKAIKPLLTCIVKHNSDDDKDSKKSDKDSKKSSKGKGKKGKGHETYTAYFGYNNLNDVAVEIPIGAKNRFVPQPTDRGQPTIFAPGYHPYVFAIEFAELPQTWQLKGPDGRTRVANANKNSRPLCNGTPTLEEIVTIPTGFGMNNYLTNNLGIPEEFIDEYWQHLVSQVEEDPLEGLQALLRGYIMDSANPTKHIKVIPVAATGNYAHLLGPAALAPANYPEVIGTGATLGNLGDKWVLSHNGDVLIPGAGYPFEYVMEDGEEKLASVGAGTSFAAPGMSLYAALWLTYPNACSFNGVNPPLIQSIIDQAKAANYSIKNNSPFMPLNCGLNQPPYITATEYIVIDEGETVLAGSLSDPDGDPVINLSVSIAGGSGGQATNNYDGTWSFTHDDGPLGPSMVTVTADDLHGGISTATFTLLVNNVAPTAEFGNTSGDVLPGNPATLAFSNESDPSVADTNAGFSYAYDCDFDGEFFSSETEGTIDSATFNCTYPEPGTYWVAGRIYDKDGGYTQYTDTVTVLELGVCYAQSVGMYMPGKRKNGTPILADRQHPERALYEQDAQSDNQTGFVALGFPHEGAPAVLVLDFYPYYIQNGEGNDLRVWETSWGDASRPWSDYPEAARVYVSVDGSYWYEVGIVNSKDQAFDIDNATIGGEPVLPPAEVRYVKLVDASNKASSKFPADADGFDVDAVEGFACTSDPGYEGEFE